jgi:hypothetical protein
MSWAAAAAFSLLWTGLLGWALLDAGCRAARSVGIAAPASVRLLAGVVLGASALWAWLMLLAAFGALGPRSAAVGIVAAFAALRARDPAPGAIPTARVLTLLLGRAPQGRLARAGAWLLAAALLLVAVEGLRRPVFDFDALSYHLPFTARVLDSGTIPHLDTPFGDPAAAYQPKTEHVLRALLAPVRGHEQLVWIGAFPHLALLWLAVYVAARSLGARRTQALWGVASTLLATVTLSQAADSLVDLPVASWWTAFAACVLAWQRGRDGAALPLVAGLALGFSFGAKYLAVGLGPLLLLIVGPALRRRRAPARWASLGIGVLATGGFFYLRSALWTGSPSYPARIELLGWPLFEGPIDRASMLAWVFNSSAVDSVPLLERLAPFVGPLVGNAQVHDLPRPVLTTGALALAPFGLWLAGTLAQLRRPAVLAFAAIAPATLILAWAAVPFTFGRFAIIASAVAGVMASLAAARRPLVVAAAVIAGIALQCALLFDRWQALLVTALLIGAAGAIGAEQLPSARRTQAWRFIATAAAALLLGFAATHRPSIIGTTPSEWRPGLRIVDSLPADARIAYAGNNVPYVFRGNVGRRVEHIPLDGNRTGRFDTRAARWAAAGLAPAISPSPGFDRGLQDPAAWLAALREAEIDVLVVTALESLQRVQIRHDARGFPIEESWARAAAPALELLHADDVMSVYAHHPDREPAVPLPAARQRREPDAFALLPHGQALARHYPLAQGELGLPRYTRTRARVEAMVAAGIDPRSGRRSQRRP